MFKSNLSPEKITRKELIKLLEYYEAEYYYIQEIENYSKSNLLTNKSIELSKVNQWLKDNYKTDCYTKLVKIKGNMKPLLHADIIVKNILYLRIDYITDLVSKQVIETIKARNEPYLILDLRNCGGGSVDATINIAKMLISEGEICSLQYKNHIHTYMAEGGVVSSFLTIYIMTSRYTMSSAELLLMSLIMNLKNVKMIGQETYKKNIGQKVLTLKKEGLRFSYSAFKWKVHNMEINDLYPTLHRSDQHIIIHMDSHYNDYIAKIYYDISGEVYQ